MRIIGKTRDYYDAALINGRDETLVFLRQESFGPTEIVKMLRAIFVDAGVSSPFRHDKMGVTVPYRDGYPVSLDRVDVDVISVTVRIVIVGFCGVLYPALKYEYHKYPRFTNATDGVEFCFVDPATVDEMSAKFESMVYQHTPLFAERHLHPSYDARRKNKKTTYFQEQFNIAALVAGSTKLEKVFIDHKVPYFVVDMYDETVTFLPTLRDYQFYKVKDAFTAMQELSMYVGGVIPQQEKELVNISDKDRIAQHGFDKLSFRHPFK